MRRLLPVTAAGGVEDVPLAWLCAQEAARRLIAAGTASWPRASFEYRATHDVLALTLILEGVTASFFGPTSHEIADLLVRLEDDVAWALWCQAELGSTGAAVLSRSDRAFAVATLRWLVSSRLLAGSFQDSDDPCGASAKCHGVGLSTGVAQAYRLLDEQRVRRQPDRPR
ncbi:hypothetical protein KNE206_77870 [Kitasatospora sp. NE20-6]